MGGSASGTRVDWVGLGTVEGEAAFCLLGSVAGVSVAADGDFSGARVDRTGAGVPAGEVDRRIAGSCAGASAVPGDAACNAPIGWGAAPRSAAHWNQRARAAVPPRPWQTSRSVPIAAPRPHATTDCRWQRVRAARWPGLYLRARKRRCSRPTEYAQRCQTAGHTGRNAARLVAARLCRQLVAKKSRLLFADLLNRHSRIPIPLDLIFRPWRFRRNEIRLPTASVRSQSFGSPA